MIDTPRKSQRVAKVLEHQTTEEKILLVRELIEQENRALLKHRYFRLCRDCELDREQMIEVVKHLYCFSVFFERVLARRITEYSSAKNPQILALARAHMREEIGHAELFRTCLEANGLPRAEVFKLEPATFTKAMFGYLTVTIQYENEYVANVVLMQVMESIGYHFFSATLKVMEEYAMVADAMAQHSQEDLEHANLGLDLIGNFDESTLRTCCRTIRDIYRLMPLVFDEWLGFARGENATGISATA